MIRVTRLDGSEMLLNQNLIEMIEETPDTHITLTNGHHYVVKESAAQIINEIIAFSARVMSRGARAGKFFSRRRH
jgi:flagellar protein FlbD